ncbi:AI-2E family transporter [Actinoplanes oblitus]|uniref:AI-2E family transporter n=1 Tax=Actinoplanes oblitus TaxID=3040509 RepID=A0ABY8WRM5_9ACTN|nr:AI-2E family transporter [Actinoplanes oblitus]WIM99646.1 AI-2E family transporter [Actinoplanes oblitus]
MAETSDGVLARRTLVVLGVTLAVLATLFLAHETRRVLTWILIAGFFAVALHPAVDWMTRKVTFCRRWLATLLVFAAAVVLLAGLVTLFVVPLARQGSQVVADFPKIVGDARHGRGPAGPLLERFHVVEYAQRNAGRFREYAAGLGAPTLAFVRSIATGIAGTMTIFVLSYLMVLEAPKIVTGFLALFEPRRADHIRRVGHDCAKTITGYLTGNLLISVICGALTFAVLALVHVPYAGLIALFVGLADLIPLVGATLGAVVATVAAFVESTTAGVVVVVFFVLYQQLENHLLQPMIFARTVRLNPLTVLVAILLAVELAGILGALLAIPVAGILQIIARDVWDVRRGRPKPEPTVGQDRVPVSAVDESGAAGHRSGAADVHAAYVAGVTDRQRPVAAESPARASDTPRR